MKRHIISNLENRQFEQMIDIAPEITSTFEPTKTVGTTRTVSRFANNRPAGLRALNAIRTYFRQSGEKFWNPQVQYVPSIREHFISARRINSA